MYDEIDQLIRPGKLVRRSEVLARPSAVPGEPGIYAWFFKASPSSRIRLDQCWKWSDMCLLYVGISPGKPPKNGKPPSRQNLKTRIGYHMRGNAEGSTLRLSLGCLLSESLEIQLRRVGSGKRMTFSSDECVLSEWMEENAFVTWITHPEPWVAESNAIERLYLPLNLDQNITHPFHTTLSKARSVAKARARKLPILPK